MAERVGGFFGLRYPQRATAIVAAAAGSGSSPSARHAWLRETSILGARVCRTRPRYDRRKDRNKRSPNSAQIQGPKALAAICRPTLQPVRAGTVEHRHPLPGATALPARSARPALRYADPGASHRWR